MIVLLLAAVSLLHRCQAPAYTTVSMRRRLSGEDFDDPSTGASLGGDDMALLSGSDTARGESELHDLQQAADLVAMDTNAMGQVWKRHPCGCGVDSKELWVRVLPVTVFQVVASRLHLTPSRARCHCVVCLHWMWCALDADGAVTGKTVTFKLSRDSTVSSLPCGQDELRAMQIELASRKEQLFAMLRDVEQQESDVHTALQEAECGDGAMTAASPSEGASAAFSGHPAGGVATTNFSVM